MYIYIYEILDHMNDLDIELDSFEIWYVLHHECLPTVGLASKKVDVFAHKTYEGVL